MPKFSVKKCAYCGKRIIFTKNTKPKKCSHCGKKEWVKPETEIKLFELQRQYLDTRDNNILGQMYIIIKDYTESIIKKIVSGKFKYDMNWLEEKAHDATNRLLEYYMNKPQFKVEKSFGGYLGWKIREVLYMDKEEEQHDSLNFTLEKDDKKELQDLSTLNHYQPLYKNGAQTDIIVREKKDLINGIEGIINSILSKIKENFSPYLAMLVCIGIKIYIENKNKNYLNKYYSYYGHQVKQFVDNSMLLVFEFIKG